MFTITTLRFLNTYEFYHRIKQDCNLITNTGDSISIIAKYDVIESILKKLSINSSSKLCSIELTYPEFNNYYKEYIITIDEEGIWCEPAWHKANQYCDEGYIYSESSIVYIHSEASSKILTKISYQNIFEFDIKEL